jgi:hypothetical protein
MKAHDPQDVINFFGDGNVVKAQEALGLESRQSIYYWIRRGRVSERFARRAQELSNGRLKFDQRVYLDS